MKLLKTNTEVYDVIPIRHVNICCATVNWSELKQMDKTNGGKGNRAVDIPYPLQVEMGHGELSNS